MKEHQRRFKSKKRGKKPPEVVAPALLTEFVPRTQNQAEYIRAIVESDVVFATGPAGCGKTACCVGLAIQYLEEGKIDKIVITKPMVEAAPKSMGALPGGMLPKTDPYLKSIYKEFEKYISKFKLKQYIEEDIIEVTPINFMRGATYERTLMILDEAQNATDSQLTLFITRIGNESKAIINGDTEQTDLPTALAGALDDYLISQKDVLGVTIVALDESDIQRNPIVGRILKARKAYNDSKNTRSTGS